MADSQADPIEEIRERHDRFWAKVDTSGDCYLWLGARNGAEEGRAYGQFWSGERNVPAHRWAWEELHGPVPEGLEVDHLCRVRLCVRPSHLDVVSHRTNVLRGVGATAINHARAFCTRGHRLEGDNLRVKARGYDCRECHRLYDLRRRTRARIARLEVELAEVERQLAPAEPKDG